MKSGFLEGKRLVIFDVDGTLSTTKSNETFRQSADDWKWLPGRLHALRYLDSQGVKLAIATNQGGVAFGYLDPHEIRSELQRMAEEAHIPYIEQFREDSPRRKPGPGMLLEIIKSSGERKEDVLMAGDREEDKGAAEAAGVSFVWSCDFFAEPAEEEGPLGEAEWERERQ